MKIIIGQKEYNNRDLVKFFITILLAVGAVWLMTYEFDKSDRIQKHSEIAEHYKYKADQYRGLIHKVMSVFKGKEDKFYNFMAIDLNKINTEAKTVGSPLAEDPTVDYIYRLLTLPKEDTLSDSLKE